MLDLRRKRQQGSPLLFRRAPLEGDSSNRQPAQQLNSNIRLRENNTLACAFIQGRLAGSETQTFSTHSGPLRQKLNITLPSTPNCVSGKNPYCLWAAPNAWWALASKPARQSGARLYQQLNSVLPKTFTVTDMTDSYCVIDVTGEAATQLLATDCCLDFHPAVFGPGQCAQTLFGQIDVVIKPFLLKPDLNQSTSEGEIGYRLLVDRSYAAYCWGWLSDAIREFE